MRADDFCGNSFIALAAVMALGVALGFSAYASDKKSSPGSVFVADKGKFNILLDGASIGREEFEIAPSGGTWIAKGSTSMKTPDGKSSKVTGALTLQPDGAPLSYDWAAQTDKNNSAHILFVNGVAKTTLQMQGAAPYNQDNSFGSPLIPVLDNNLYHQFELLARIYDWNKKGAQTFPVDRKSTRLNSSHTVISYAVFCLQKKKARAQMEFANEWRGITCCQPVAAGRLPALPRLGEPCSAS